MPTCPKCNRDYSSTGIKMHMNYCTGVGYVSSTVPRIKKKKRNKNHNDKTIPTVESTTVASSQGVVTPGLGIASKSLTEINLKGEYDKMTETLNPKKETAKEKKYQCGACNAMFDNLNNGKCPDCGVQLQ